MVDYKNIIKGELFFIIGYILIIIINEILNPLTEALETITSNTEINGVIWFGAILIYIIAGVIMPIMYIYQGITTDTQGNQLQNILIAIIMFIINIALTIKGWYIVTNLATLTTDGFITAIFWIGLILVWISCVIITPAYIIIKNMERN